MNSLILGLIIFQLVISIDALFPTFFKKCLEFHYSCFEHMNLEVSE